MTHRSARLSRFPLMVRGSTSSPWTHHEWDTRVALLVLGVALAVGVLSAAASPAYVAAGLVGLAVVALIWRQPVVGVFLFVAVVATLPFGVIPVQVGAQLTFVDALFIATFSSLLLQMLLGTQPPRLRATGWLLLGFVGVASVAFVLGTGSSPASPELIRRFGKLLVSVLFFIVALSLLAQTETRLERLTRWLMFAGALQGAIGTGLMLLKPATQQALLSSLRVVGYPTSDVLRYVPGPNDTYTDQLRAIGTSVDPNVFGGTLMLACALIAVQCASPRPVLPRLVLLALGAPTLAGIVLSLSRASWLGLGVSLALAGVLRYRRLLVIGLLAALVLVATPVGQQAVVRFMSGFSTADRATAFRFGEYANALTLIQRYPLFGIGFGASPDIDVTAGVSSVYLLVAEQTGLIGLGVYVSALGATWRAGLRGLTRSADPRLQGIALGYWAALSGAFVAGLLDHYFANQAFPHAVALFWLYAAALQVTGDR